MRFISNPSTGRQGFALAQAALDRGAAVTLIAGPTQLPTPVGAERVDVVTVQEMQAAVLAAVGQADALLMAAAVGDYSPADVATRKIKKAGDRPCRSRARPIFSPAWPPGGPRPASRAFWLASPPKASTWWRMRGRSCWPRAST